jgi:prefoldin subunit 5
MAAMVAKSESAPQVNTPYMRLIHEDKKNPRGIPAALFIESVEDFLKEENIEAVLGALNELYSKYKYMEGSFERSKNIYKGKVPDLEQTLELVKLMKARKENDEEMHANYNLTDTLYAKAKLNLEKEKVVLYVGAKVLIEYSFDEAIELLSEQIVQSHAKLEELNEDLAFLRMSEITVEVNMSRIFNYSVKLKKEAEAKA